MNSFINRLIGMLLLITLFFSSFVIIFQINPSLFNDSSDPYSTDANFKISAEEEDIDSWDVAGFDTVNNKDGRYNKLANIGNENFIEQSELHIITTVNTSSGSSEFALSRALADLEETGNGRYKTDGGGNQTEFFRDEIGDLADFTEDNEGFVKTAGQAATNSVSNGIYKYSVTGSGGTSSQIKIRAVSFNIELVNKFIVRYKGNANDDFTIELRGSSLGWSALASVTTEWQTVEWDTSTFSTNWNATETQTQVRLMVREVSGNGNLDGDEILELDYFQMFSDIDYFTFDNSEGDTLDWNEADDEGFTNKDRCVLNQDSTNGWENISFSTNFVNARCQSASISIDTSLYTTMKIKITANVSDINLRIQDQNNVDLTPNILLTMSFVELEINLTADSDWTGIISQLVLFFDESGGDGVLEITDLVTIDYILLLGNFQETSLVYGLTDSDDNPVLNISTTYFANQSSVITIDLMDIDLNIAYSATSSLLTGLQDKYMFFQLTYSILESSLTVDISFDNGTRLIKKSYDTEGTDFTVISGRIPLLFQLSQNAKFFLSSWTDSTSWNSFIWDYLEMSFEDNQWTQKASPITANWVTDSNFRQKVDGSMDDEEIEYQLYVPHLDALSATFFVNSTDMHGDAGSQLGQTFLRIFVYAVDAITGQQEFLMVLRVGFSMNGVAGTTDYVVAYLLAGGIEQVITFGSEAGTTAKSVEMDWTFTLQEDRTKIIMSYIARKASDATITSSNAFDIDVSDLTMANPSQEFILELEYKSVLDSGVTPGTSETLWEVNEFVFLKRQFFEDGVGIPFIPSNEPDRDTGIFAAVVNPIIGLFNWIVNRFSDIFKPVFDGLGVIFEALGSLLDPLLVAIDATLGTVFSILQDVVEVSIDAIFDFIQDPLGFINDILTIIQDMIGDFLNSIVNFIEDTLVPGLITAANDTWEVIWDTLFSPILGVDLTAMIAGIAQADFGATLTDAVNMLVWIIDQIYWVLIILILFIWTFAIVNSRNNIEGITQVGANSTKTIGTPTVGLLGFTVGFKLYLFVILGIMLLLGATIGWIPDVLKFPF